MAEPILKSVPSRPNLRQKLVACMNELERVEKRGDNRAQGYKYVMAADIIDAARDVLAKNGVAFLASELSIEDRDGYETRNGAHMNVVRVRMKFMFMDADSEESLEIFATGEGQDTGDKGINKAKTAAIKYVLQQNLLMSTGDDPEDERGARADYERPAQPAQPRPQYPKAPPCPACGHATALTRKRDGTWACFASKGGCDEEFTQESLDEELAAADPTPAPKNAPQGTTAQARGTPEGNGDLQRERLVATDEQIKQVLDLIQESRVPDETHAWVLKNSAVNNITELNPTQAKWWIETLIKKRDERGNGKKGRK